MCYKFYGIYTIINIIKYKYKFIKKLFVLYTRKDDKLRKVIYLAKLKFLVIEFVNNNILNNLIKSKYKINHQGVVVLVKKNISFSRTKDDFLNLLIKPNNFILILDRINDPYNLGSCIRTAVAAGVNILIISKHNTVSLKNNIVHKVSTGAIYKIFILEVVNLCKIIKVLHDYNFFVVSTTILNSKYTLFNFNFKNYNLLAIIFGSEEKGVKKSIQDKSDCLIKIPMLNNCNSLNISVSNGIFLFEILRQRNYS